MRNSLGLALVSGLLLCSAPAARAATYDVHGVFSSNPSYEIELLAHLTTDETTILPSGGYAITGISGTLTAVYPGPSPATAALGGTSAAITGLVVNPNLNNTSNWWSFANFNSTTVPFDNMFFSSTSHIDDNGVMFTLSSGSRAVLWFVDGLLPHYSLEIAFIETYSQWGSDVAITPTPLPAAMSLFAGGLGAFGLIGWRRKRKRAVPA